MTLPVELSCAGHRRKSAAVVQGPAAGNRFANLLKRTPGARRRSPTRRPFLLTVTGRGAFAARLYCGPATALSSAMDGAAAFVDRTGCAFETAGREFPPQGNGAAA